MVQWFKPERHRHRYDYTVIHNKTGSRCDCPRKWCQRHELQFCVSLIFNTIADNVRLRGNGHQLNIKTGFVIVRANVHRFALESISAGVPNINFPYFCSYKTDDSEHEQRGYVVNGELMVMGSYSITHPNGAKSMTLYTADKKGYRTQVKFRLSDALRKSAVGRK